MSELSSLSPQPLWDIFAKICSIPHPSYHEEALASYIVARVRERGLHAERDATGNILIKKPATPGFGQCQTVALQAHLDMVPQKNNDTVHDFTRNPIRPRIEGEWIKASGTTLGADNGIGLASTLAVLEDNDIQHGPLEVLLTMTEETGMVGAFGLMPGWLSADILINTDSEEEGEVYVGCAGGIDVTTTLPIVREPTTGNHLAVRITLKGLKGGHSGCDIHLGLGNANKLLARFLYREQQSVPFRVSEFSGGTLRNAIPREVSTTLLLAEGNLNAFLVDLEQFQRLLQSELGLPEKNIQLVSDSVPTPDTMLTAASQQQFLALLNSMPNGVIRNSDAMPGVVETSLNVGIVNLEEKNATIRCLVRSLADSGKESVVEMLRALGDLSGASTEAKGSYPGWQPDPHSTAMTLVQQTYQQLFGHEPHVQVIHAGLECGLFKKPYPQMDMVSIGPTITGPHSPDEQVNIASVERYWQLLTALLKAIPEKR
ncbi:MAG: Cytosol non-specific dipeptidase [Candidatus Erwinia impunctatus]